MHCFLEDFLLMFLVCLLSALPPKEVVDVGLFTACVIISLLVSLALPDFVAAMHLLCNYFDEHM